MVHFWPIYESELLEGLAGNIGKVDLTFRETHKQHFPLTAIVVHSK